MRGRLPQGTVAPVGVVCSLLGHVVTACVTLRWLVPGWAAETLFGNSSLLPPPSLPFLPLALASGCSSPHLCLGGWGICLIFSVPIYPVPPEHTSARPRGFPGMTRPCGPSSVRCRSHPGPDVPILAHWLQRQVLRSFGSGPLG